MSLRHQSPSGERGPAGDQEEALDDPILSEPADNAPLPEFAFFVRRLGRASRWFLSLVAGRTKALASAYARRPEQQGIPIEVTLMKLVPVERVDIDGGDHQ
jgi:hypothetical protein